MTSRLSLPAIGHVELRTSNAERLTRFYHDAMGLFVSVVGPARVAFCADDHADPLVVLHVDPGAPVRQQKVAGLYHLALLMPDRQVLGTVVARLIRGGAALDGAADHLVSEAVYFSDPDRNGVEVYVDRPRDTWQWDGERVVMDNAPIDLNDLLSLEMRTSLPVTRGARIGHIHLHVADLERSTRFYADVLEMSVMSKFGRGTSFLAWNRYHHHIGLNTWMGRGIPPAPHGETGLERLSIRVDAAHARRIISTARARGAAISTSVDEVEIIDPDGHKIALETEPIA